MTKAPTARIQRGPTQDELEAAFEENVRSHEFKQIQNLKGSFGSKPKPRRPSSALKTKLVKQIEG